MESLCQDMATINKLNYIVPLVWTVEHCPHDRRHTDRQTHRQISFSKPHLAQGTTKWKFLGGN